MDFSGTWMLHFCEFLVVRGVNKFWFLFMWLLLFQISFLLHLPKASLSVWKVSFAIFRFLLKVLWFGKLSHRLWELCKLLAGIMIMQEISALSHSELLRRFRLRLLWLNNWMDFLKWFLFLINSFGFPYCFNLFINN